MNAAPELRYVERWLNYNPITGEDLLHGRPVRILQQKWVGENNLGEYAEDWFDVPTVKETP